MKQMMLLLCAWVLWGNYVNSTPNNFGTAEPEPLFNPANFEPLDAFATKDECVNKKDGLEAFWQRFGKTKRASFLCLPDTVDPRGVKGGKP